MSSISEEIQQLKSKILDLENLIKEKDEKDKKKSLDHKFKIINEFLIETKLDITNNLYSNPLSRFYDKKLVTHLEEIINILQIINK